MLINLQIFQYLYYAFTIGKNGIENIKKNKVPYICIGVVHCCNLHLTIKIFRPEEWATVSGSMDYNSATNNAIRYFDSCSPVLVRSCLGLQSSVIWARESQKNLFYTHVIGKIN